LGVQVSVFRREGQIEVEIPNEILPEEYVTTKIRVEKTIDRPLYVYRGRGPRKEEGYFEAIRAARERRYAIGVTIPVSEIPKKIGEVRLTSIYYPPVPGVRVEGVWVDVPERPLLELRYYTKDLWRAEIPYEIVRKYSLYAFPRDHLLYLYTPTAKISWEYEVTLPKPPKTPDIYHVGNYYTPEWRRNVWVWKVPKNNPCYDALETGLDIGARPFAQCFFEDGTVYIDFLFSPEDGRRVARRLGYAYVNSYVRNYTLTPAVRAEKDYPFLAEIRATYVSACPIEFRQFGDRHMKLCSLEGKSALGITVWNILHNFFVGMHGRNTLLSAEAKDTVWYTVEEVDLRDYYYERLYEEWGEDAEPYGTLYKTLPAFGLKEDDSLIETAGTMINEKYDYEEIKSFPFYRCYKYVRVINEQSYKRAIRGARKYRQMYEYLNHEIESELKTHPDKIVDKDGFIWRRRG